MSTPDGSSPATASAPAPDAPVPLSIPRVSASSLSAEQFVQQFVQQSRAVIIEGALEAWMNAAATTAVTQAGAGTATATAADTAASASSPSSDSSAAGESASAEWSIALLAQLLDGEVMNNVFVTAPHNRRRFKFYKQQQAASSPSPPSASAGQPNPTGEAPAAAAVAASSNNCIVTSAASSSAHSQSPSTQVEPGLSRLSLPFNEFVARACGHSAETGQPAAQGADAADAYYLYGEPMPLSSVGSPLTSTLLWVSPGPTVSPLHFDMSEGVLCQLQGSKLVTLADPSVSEQLYPYPARHVHDRQSRVDDIHAPDAARFPLALGVQLRQGELRAGDLLYIPYAHWHQLESRAVGISVSMRWNPYTDALRQAALSAQAARSLPPHLRAAIQTQLLDSLAVPTTVRDVNIRRWKEIAEEKGQSGDAALQLVED